MSIGLQPLVTPTPKNPTHSPLDVMGHMYSHALNSHKLTCTHRHTHTQLKINKPGMGVHAVNISTWEVEASGSS